MAMFVLIAIIIQNCFACVTGTENFYFVSGDNKLRITPSNVTAGRYIGLYESGDNLNLSCIFTNVFLMSDVALGWNFPRAFNRSKSIYQISANLVNLLIDNLTESDSGEYKCIANVSSLLKLEKSIQINVKTRKGGCSEKRFQCYNGNCIWNRFKCDGLKDCRDGEDESWTYCGSWNPCENKLRCPDGRCIPFEWCCDPERDRNCTIKVKNSCCIHMEKLTRDIDSDLGFPYEKHKFNDMGFVQNLLYRLHTNSTTIYTVIGCAFSFLFVVTLIIVIKSCRTQMRRSVITRCPAASRNLGILRSSNLHANHLNYLPFYGNNRSGCVNADFMSINPLVVTYNIENGVRFVGRPIDPPPYCEILTSPPREGPPPPYASRESLHTKIAEERDFLDAGVENNENESDNLLESRNRISVISCNEMDVAEDAGKSDVLQPTDESNGVNAN